MSPSRSVDPSRRLGRRELLVGGAAAGLLAACGGGSSPGSAPTTTRSGQVLVSLFDGSTTLTPGSPQRATFGIGDASGAIVPTGPARLTMTVTDAAGRRVGRPLVARRHDAGLTRGYYPIEVVPPRSGPYRVRAELDGHPVDATFAVGDNRTVTLPRPGRPFPSIATPTTARTDGVAPICTRDPVCPLHAVDLRTALAAHRPTALLVATPAYCQVAMCGPVLDLLLAERDRFAGLTFIHAEVYRSGAEVERSGTSARLAPAVEALHLLFEPALFLIDGAGTLRTRLDSIFDAVELRRALTDLAG